MTTLWQIVRPARRTTSPGEPSPVVTWEHLGVSTSPTTDGADEVDAYLAAVPETPRATLESTRSTLHRLLPRAVDAMKYGMPAVLVDGNAVAGYAAFKEHCGYYPMSGAVIERAAEHLGAYATSKGGLQFPLDRALPVGLVRRLVRLRLDELGEVTNGVRREYFDDGTIKAEGRMRKGELDGPWHWFRKDGTPLRSGSFRLGERVGTWTTFDADGHPAKVTELG